MEITIGDKKYELNRFLLKEWVELESLKEKVFEQAKHGNVEGFSEAILSCVSLCVNVNMEEIKDEHWMDIVIAYQTSQKINQSSIEFPIFLAQIKKQKQIGWDYEGRSWYVWVHTLARAFGWSLDYIAKLVVEDAIALMEEIFVQDQLDKEWEWSCSEIAYSSKDGKFSPLPRPPWMKSSFKDMKEELMKTKMPKFMMPVGKIVRAKWIQDDTQH